MRAILLAAGMGMRLKPITIKIPKSLIEVDEKPLLERQIEYLREVGVEEIIVVTGYLAEKFCYLEKKYGVKLVNNMKFQEYNNIYTMYLVKEYLEDTYVIDADVYLNKNILKSNLEYSTYFTGKKLSQNEWRLHWNSEGVVENITIETGENYIMSGISYWTKNDGKKIVEKLNEKIEILLNPTDEKELEKVKKLYWDDIVKENLDILDIRVELIGSDDWYEIDNLEELEDVKSKIKAKKVKK